MNLGFWIAWFRYQKLKLFPFEYLVWKQRILPWEEFQPEFVCNSVLQKDFFSLWILHESCSLVCVDEFELLNRLISISEAQYIPIWISSKNAGNIVFFFAPPPPFCIRFLRLIRSLHINPSEFSFQKKLIFAAVAIFCSNLGSDSDLVSCNI